GHQWRDLLEGGSNDPSTAKIRSEKVSIRVDNTVFDQSAGYLTIKDSSISAAKLMPLQVQLSSTADSVFEVDSRDATSKWFEVKGLSVKVTASGRPIMIVLAAAAPGAQDATKVLAAYVLINPNHQTTILNQWDLA